MDEIRRKWPQYSLRWVFVQVTLIALACGVYQALYPVESADREPLLFLLVWIELPLVGAIIGGFFDRFWRGALIAFACGAPWCCINFVFALLSRLPDH